MMQAMKCAGDETITNHEITLKYYETQTEHEPLF